MLVVKRGDIYVYEKTKDNSFSDFDNIIVWNSLGEYIWNFVFFFCVEEIKKGRTENSNLNPAILINDIEPIYEKKNNIYYYTIPSFYEGKKYFFKVDLPSGFKYKLVDQNMFGIKVDYTSPIEMIVYNDQYYSEIKIVITNLPIVSIHTENQSQITSLDVNSSFMYLNQETLIHSYLENAKVHIRGSSSTAFPKHSYKIDIYDEQFQETKNIQFSDFYYGHSFILDAVYRDQSKIRDVLANDIWNEISNDFSDVNIDDEYVELFVNNQYQGIYVLKEPLNRKTLNLNRSGSNDTSVIVKGTNWNFYLGDTNFDDITTDSYHDLELKYPNDSNLYSKVWKQFHTIFYPYYGSNQPKTDEMINNTFDRKNYIDLIIFNAFINNMDNNRIKNNCFYMNSLSSNKMYIWPWDMEYSFGLILDETDSFLLSQKVEDYDTIYTTFIHADASGVNKELIERYWELRKDVLSLNYLDSLIDGYENDLLKGASLRDSTVWYNCDIEKEIEDVREWIHQRLEFFDGYVRSLEDEWL